jgi:YbgC/YbaW family acyl-CoA thioester hydrolase
MLTFGRDPEPPAISHSWALALDVRPTDLDNKGHVNNARFVEYLQFGRWRWLERSGITEESLKGEGVALVVVHLEVNYRAEVNYPDQVTVNTSVRREGEKKLIWEQKVMRSDGVLATEAMVVMLPIDLASRKSRAVPESLARVLVVKQAEAK